LLFKHIKKNAWTAPLFPWSNRVTKILLKNITV
jgi:hypothetical protein